MKREVVENVVSMDCTWIQWIQSLRETVERQGNSQGSNENVSFSSDFIQNHTNQGCPRTLYCWANFKYLKAYKDKGLKGPKQALLAVMNEFSPTTQTFNYGKGHERTTRSFAQAVVLTSVRAIQQDNFKKIECELWLENIVTATFNRILQELMRCIAKRNHWASLNETLNTFNIKFSIWWNDAVHHGEISPNGLQKDYTIRQYKKHMNIMKLLFHRVSDPKWRIF